MVPTLFYQYRPAPPLDRFIERLIYWVSEPPANHKDRIMPDGSGSLIINLVEDEVRSYVGDNDDVVQRMPGAVYVGAHSKYSVIDAAEQTAIIGVTFRPGGMWPFFDVAADELQNSHAGLGELWGAAGRTIRERILAVPSPYGRLAYLERELRARAIRPFALRPEVAFVLKQLAAANDAVTIERLGEQAGLSTRRLSRLFAIEVGLTPKLYARVQRFHRVFSMLGARHIDWSEVAPQCGYFDQSHLIRDCKLMSGFTPTELHQRWSGNGHHVPL